MSAAIGDRKPKTPFGAIISQSCVGSPSSIPPAAPAHFWSQLSIGCADEYRPVVARLAELGESIDFDVFDEIVTKNLHGVDLNAESVEITRLSLWLKTARRHHRLQNLESDDQDRRQPREQGGLYATALRLEARRSRPYSRRAASIS